MVRSHLLLHDGPFPRDSSDQHCFQRRITITACQHGFATKKPENMPPFIELSVIPLNSISKVSAYGGTPARNSSSFSSSLRSHLPGPSPARRYPMGSRVSDLTGEVDREQDIPDISPVISDVLLVVSRVVTVGVGQYPRLRGELYSTAFM